MNPATQPSDALAEHEIGGAYTAAITLNIVDMFHASGASPDVIEDVICGLAQEVESCDPMRFFEFRKRPATGATYHLTATFLADEFGQYLTETANELLLRRVHQ